MPALANLAHGQPGWVHPGAAPLAAEHASLGGGLVNVTETYFGIASGDFHFQESAGALAQGTWAPVDRLLVTGAGGVLLLDLEYPIPFGVLGLRWNLIESEHWNLGVFADGGVGPRPQWAVTAGVAVEGGGERVRLDASLPLTALWRGPTAKCGSCDPWDSYTFFPPWLAPLLGEAGVSLALGEQDALRLGTTYLLPNLRWRHAWEDWYLDSALGIAPGYRFSEVLLVEGGRRW